MKYSLSFFLQSILLAAPIFASEPSYSIRDIGVLPGGRTSYPTGINNARQIVGASENANGILHAFVWSADDGMKDLGSLGSAANAPYTASKATAINGSGTIVGQSGESRAMVVKSGVMSALPVFYTDGASDGQANGVNAAGDIVGVATSAIPREFLGGQTKGPPHAFLYKNGVLTDLGTINSTAGQSAAYGMNDQGDIVGQSDTPAGNGFDHAFVHRGGVLTDLGTLPGFQESAAGAINGVGQIIGYARTNSIFFPVTHGFLYSGGTMRDIGTLPGGDYAMPLGINSSGLIVGSAIDRNGRRSAFVYTSTSGMSDISNRTSVIVGSKSGYTGLVEAVAVNDLGVIAATGSFSDGTTHAFILIPDDAAPASIASQPVLQAVAIGATAAFSVTASGGTLAYQWAKNGVPITSATTSGLTLGNVQVGNAGLYSVSVSSGVNSVGSDWAPLGISSAAKVVGSGDEVGPNIYVASNGNTFDQVLLKGAAAAITADYSPDPKLNQITRISYVDLDDDIVQVEFSGPGTLSLVLDNPTGPAAPVNYNQSTTYMKGHAGIVITGATEKTNVSVFSVGRATAVNQALFKDDVTYDGVADIAFIAISSANGKFGGLRTADASYFAAKGPTGLYAPGVTFQGPIFIGNLNAFDSAMPAIVVGSVADARITGGDLFQPNGQAVKVAGLTQLKFTDGQDSHAHLLRAQANRAVLRQNGVDVTSQIVVNPGP